MKRKKGISQDSLVLLILFGILIVCFITICFIFYNNFYGGIGKDKYGDRLEGIEKYPLSKTLSEDIASLYKDTSSVNKTVVDVQGKIIYITIDFKESLKVENAQNIAIKALDKIGESNLKFYEIQFILTSSIDEENLNFPIFGSKNANSLKVVW